MLTKYLTPWFCPTILCWSAALMYHVHQLHCLYFNTHSADIRLSGKVKTPLNTGATSVGVVLNHFNFRVSVCNWTPVEVSWTSSKNFNLLSLSLLSSSHFHFRLFSPTCFPNVHQKAPLPHQHHLFCFSISFFGENAEKEKGRKTFTIVERERIWPRVCFKFLCLIKAKK